MALPDFLDNPPIFRNCNQVRPVVCAQFAINAPDVLGDRALGQAELRRQLVVAQPSSNATHDRLLLGRVGNGGIWSENSDLESPPANA
jgi:hypothetical protein